MKTFIKKHLSVLLSLAIILGTILPVISGFMGVSALSPEEQAAVEKLKTAAAKMYTYDGTLLVPIKTYVTGTGRVTTNMTASTSVIYGSHTATVDVPTAATFSGTTNDGIWFTANSDVISNEPGAQIGSGVTNEAYLTFRVNSIADGAESTTIRFRYRAGNNANGTNYNEASTYEITVRAGEEYTVSLSEIFAGTSAADWKTYFTEKYIRFLCMTALNTSANITVGSAVCQSNYSPSDAEGVDFVNEMKEFKNSDEYASYYNTEEFEAALQEAIKAFPEDTNKIAKELIEAWGEMTKPAESKLYPTAYQTTGASDRISGLWANGTAASDEEKAYIGEKYVTLDMVAAEGRTAVNGGSNTNTLFIGDGTNLSTTIRTSGSEADGWICIKINSVTEAGRLGFKLIKNGSAVRVSGYYIDVTEANKGKWIKVSLNDLMPMGDITNWKTDFAEGANTLSRFELQLVDGAKANISVGTLMFAPTVSAPEGAADMKLSELLEAAMAVDVSKYGNTEKFLEKLEALKLISEEAFALVQLKTAWGKMTKPAESKLYPTAYQTTGVSDRISGLWVNGTASSDEEKAFVGEKYASLDMEAAPGRTAVSGGENSYTLFLGDGTNLGTTTRTSGNEADGWIYIKINSVTKAGRLGFKLITNGNQPRVSGFYIDVNDENKGKWIKVSLDDLMPMGNTTDWKTDFVEGANTLTRFELQLVDGAKANISVGTLMFVPTVLPLEGDDGSWNLADWIYKFSSVEYKKYNGAEAFEEALRYAIDVRDRLQISCSANVTNFDDAASADADVATIGGTNVLATLIPVIEHSADGNTKEEVASAAPELFTDGDSATIGAVTGLDNSNEASFTDFIYRFEGEGNISDFVIYNDIANTANKYYIYIANTRSDLFLQKNLLVPFTNEENKAVQRFNFDGKPDVAGTYVGIRVFGNTDTVSFAEFKAFGEVRSYEVETGNFSNDKIASIGNNLLVGKTPKVRTKAGIKMEWAPYFVGKKYKPNDLVDADVSTPVAITGPDGSVAEKEDTISFHFYYDLGSNYTIDKLFINHWNVSMLATGRYEIYASSDVNSLFLSRNRLISYDNTVDGPNGTSISQLFTLKNNVIARYISFHITYPISDWEQASKSFKGALNIRLTELGVYGTEWKKPDALVNLTSHTPVDVYRTDADGKRTEVSEAEYDGIEHKNTYDGNDATLADIKIKNGEKLDFVYNLAAEMTLEEICMKLGVGSVKKMNIYTSTVADSLWDDSSLIYSTTEGLGETYIGKGYASSPIKARYLRFEILENEGEDLIINEIAAIGGNDQEFTYMNLIEEKSDSASFYLVDKTTGKYLSTTYICNRWMGSWNANSKYHIRNAFDNDVDSVYDLFGGKNGEQSVNILLDLGTLNSIDNISLLAGSSKEYWPTELNFYFGENDLTLFDKDIKPAKSWTQASDDAYYTYEFVPQVAQYVRIEFLRGEHETYQRYFDHIGAVIAGIQVNGLELKSRAVNGIAITVEDEETGIKAEVLALRDNDVFEAIQDIMVVKREATAEEKASAMEQSLKIVTDVYEIIFIDSNGNMVTDTGGREVVIYIPESLYSTTEDIFVLKGGFGGLEMIEFENKDGYYFFSIDDISSVITVALGQMVEIISDDPIDTGNDIFSDDYYSDNDDYDDDFYEDEDETESEEDEEETKRRKKVIKVRKNGKGFDYLWIIIVAVAVVVVAAGTFLVIFLIKKKKEKEDLAE